jgi:hypothetical protein
MSAAEVARNPSRPNRSMAAARTAWRVWAPLLGGRSAAVAPGELSAVIVTPASVGQIAEK